MRVQTMLIASAAAPAVAGLGYAVLTGYLMSKVKPVPIAMLTEMDGETGGIDSSGSGDYNEPEDLPVRERELVAV